VPTILCVDDDPRTLDLEKAIFEKLGYTVLVSADGRAALATASQHGVDVAVLDYRMPGMDGAEVAEALWRQQPGLPIVVCSGYFDTIPEWLKWFAAGCVQKGDGPEALVSAVQGLIPKNNSQSSAA
jgi:CheY-like chemotaxis protein